MAKVELDAKELADLCIALRIRIQETKRIFGTTELGDTLATGLEKTFLKLDEARKKEVLEHVS